jgi:peptidoglycan hydrolase-like protein with peptidoglycan-binding domain
MFWPLQQQGSTGETVRTVQYLVNAQGATLVVDGIFGSLTASAVSAFQSARGLVADGVVGDQTWPALIVQLASGNSGEAVRAVQSQINSRSSGWLTVNGVFGQETADAVSAFQEPIGLTVNGVVNWYTWHALVMSYLTAQGGQSASNGLFQAWTNNDQSAATNYATGDALATLFARAFHASDGWAFEMCEGAAGHFICTWKRPGGSLALQGNDNTGAPFYYVEGVQFQP